MAFWVINGNGSSESPKSNVKFFYGYLIVIAAFFIMVLTIGTFNAFGVFFKPLSSEFGWSRAITSSAISLSWIAQGLFTIIAGRFNDRFGPRIVTTICGIIMGLAYILMSQVHSLWQLYLFYVILISAGMSGAFIPLASTIAKWFFKRRSVMTGIVVSGSGIGGLIAPPFANWLISVYDWRKSYIVLGGITLVLIVVFSQFLRSEPTRMGQKPYGENKEDKSSERISGGFGLKEAAYTSQFWLISSIFFCVGFGMYTILVHIVPHVTDLGFSAGRAADILAIASGSGVVGRVVFGNIGDRIGDRQVFIIGFVLMAIAFLLLAPSVEIWKLYLFVVIFGFATGGMITSESPIVAKYFGLKSHGLLLAVTTLGFCVGSAAGPFLTGYIFDLTNSYQLAFLICAGLSVTGLILTLILKPTSKTLKGLALS